MTKILLNIEDTSEISKIFKNTKNSISGWKYFLNAILNTWSPWRSCSWGGWGRWRATCRWTPDVSSWCRTWNIGLSHFGRKQVAPDVHGVHPQIGDVVGDDLLKQGLVALDGDVPHLSHCDHLIEPGQKSKPQRIIHRLFQLQRWIAINIRKSCLTHLGRLKRTLRSTTGARNWRSCILGLVVQCQNFVSTFKFQIFDFVLKSCFLKNLVVDCRLLYEKGRHTAVYLKL